MIHSAAGKLLEARDLLMEANEPFMLYLIDMLLMEAGRKLAAEPRPSDRGPTGSAPGRRAPRRRPPQRPETNGRRISV